MSGVLIAIIAAASAISLILGWLLQGIFGKLTLRKANKEAKSIIDDARIESENLKKEKLVEAEEELYTKKHELEDEYTQKINSLNEQELELNNKDANIDRKADLLSKKEKELLQIEQNFRNRERQLGFKEEKVTNLLREQNQMLEKVAGMSAEEARNILMNNLLDEARQNVSKKIHAMMEEAKADAEVEAQKIVITAIQQAGIDVAIESTASVVHLPTDEMKGRIIGREGRNIRSFEIVTGVDVIVDDTPGTIILSSFDPLRREIARLVMEKLVADGRIHPGRIEDMYEKTRSEMNAYLRDMGEQALLECGIHGLHNDLISMLGKLRFRTSYGQNMLQHSKEVAIFAGIMAAELGLDVNLAKRAGILHDIGRSVDHFHDVNHAQMGYDLAKKYNEHPVVLNAIAAHHGDIEANSPISILVQTANEISSKRPGARREVIENFIQRLRNMEDIALSFEGVSNAYAIQAGKEVRVIVSHDKVDDISINQLAYDIAKRFENDVEYPGQVKIMVIREFRGVDFA